MKWSFIYRYIAYGVDRALFLELHFSFIALVFITAFGVLTLDGADLSVLSLFL